MHTETPAEVFRVWLWQADNPPRAEPNKEPAEPLQGEKSHYIDHFGRVHALRRSWPAR